MTKKQKKLLLRIIISLILFIAACLIEHFTSLHRVIILFLYLVPYFTAGYDVVSGFFRKLIRGKLFDEELLMTIATVGALIIGEYPESVFVMVFFQTGELFQSVAVGKSRKSIASLMDICPDTARAIRDGKEYTLMPEEVSPDEIIIIRPGERIPLDSIVTGGESSLNTSALTGESAPCEVYEGCEIKAGSINLSGTLYARVIRPYEDSTLAKILELVENSSLNKARAEKFLSRFARYYTPCVVILALLLAVIPSVITGEVREWVSRALIFLVVSCPCALVISVPLTFFSGIGGASSRGILVKGSSYLEALSRASVFVFDKTGTLTTGEFTVSGVFPAEGISSVELLSKAAAAEYYSNHPVARGIIRQVREITPADSAREYPGGGVEAYIGKERILAGNRRLMEAESITVPETVSEGTGVYIAADGRYLGYIKLSDTIKPEAKSTIAELKKAGIKRIIMLTGDNKASAEEIAEKAGITEYRYSLLPGDKATVVKNLREEYKGKGNVIFVGDGINDAPVLAFSDTGIAMGGIGSDAAIEAADIVIMDDSLEKCVTGLKIAKKTRKIVIQNVVFALFVKFGVLFLASFGFANMWIGVLADVGVAVLAILNAVRALKSR